MVAYPLPLLVPGRSRFYIIFEHIGYQFHECRVPGLFAIYKVRLLQVGGRGVTLKGTKVH